MGKTAMMPKIVSIYDVAFKSGFKHQRIREMTDEWLDFIFCMWSD